MRRLSERFVAPNMADEAIDTVESPFEFARRRAADAFSIKLTKHGGMLPTRKVATIAQAAGISLFGGTMLESGIGTAAYPSYWQPSGENNEGFGLTRKEDPARPV